MPTRYPQEQMHRIRYTTLTGEQIASKLSTTPGGPAGYGALTIDRVVLFSKIQRSRYRPA